MANDTRSDIDARPEQERAGRGSTERAPAAGIGSQLDLLRDKILLLGGKTEAAVRGEAGTTRTQRDCQCRCREDKVIDQMELR